jgi:putative holliday junction resolvase
VAVANSVVRIASPLVTLNNDDVMWPSLTRLITDNRIGTVVVGLPRGLDGQTTAQTQKAEAFMRELRQRIDVPVEAQDEAATSVLAEEELKSRGKPYDKVSIDALAATYILEDFLQVWGNR